MSQRIINLVSLVGRRETIPVGVQTGVRQDRGIRFRETSDGRWSFEIRRPHGTSFGGPFRGLPAAMERASRVQLALAATKIAV